MGQKVNPHGFRVGINKNWDSNWIADKKNVAAYILEDNKVREFIKNNYKNCGISKIVIERNNDTKLLVSLHTSRPGMVIGQKGAGVEAMKAAVSKVAGNKEVNINVIEIKTPDLDAQLVAESIAAQLDQRVVCRRAMKQAIARCQKAGVKGIKVMCSGRINNAEIARSEILHFGSIPLQTLRADIDYGFAEATIYGRLGVKVWIYKGEILGKVNLTKQAQGGRD
jgi:small subunit ribosomal protein S3